MKQHELVRAYRVVSKLANQNLPLPIAYKLYKLRERMKRFWDFQAEEEEKLFREYSPEYIGNGEMKFKTSEERACFEKAMSAIGDMDVDEKIEPVSFPVLDELKLSVDDIDAVKPVLTFEE